MSKHTCCTPAPSAVRHRFQARARRSALAASIAALLCANAYAQDTAGAPDAATELDTVQVTGTRSSVTKAQLVKQNAEQVVDSIVAEDIGKLPDNNVAEALQRISGIQIDRNFGEGSSIAIRGLTQVRTELNGRDIFTANDGRGLSFEDVSAELLAGVNVYKNPSAEMIEGGLGGTVDLRTRLPFDFDGMKIAGSAQYNYYDLADKGEAAYSGLFSNRWQTGIGEIGVLVNASKQDGSFRRDVATVSTWWLQDNIPGQEQGVYVPHGGGITSTLGDRERETSSLAVQWRPNDDVEVYLQAMRSDYHFQWHDYSFFAYTGDAAIKPTQDAGDYTFNERGEMVAGVFTNVPIASNTSLTRRHSVTSDYSGGARWTVNPNLTLSTDFQYVDATTKSTRYIINTATPTDKGAPYLHMDLSGDLARMWITDATGAEGFAADPSNYAGWLWHLDNKDDNEATEFAWRADMDLAFDDSFARSFKAGVRVTDRDATNRGNVWRFMCLNNCAGIPFDQAPGVALVQNPVTDFFRGGGYFFGPTLTASDAAVENYEQTLAAFGADPLTFGPNNINTQGEKTYAAYGVLRFGTDGDIPFDGNIGVRVVRTEVSSEGVRTATDAEGGGLLPIDAQQTYTDVLPSLNLRWFLRDNLQWRFAASRGISRPTFDKLNPNLSLDTTDAGGITTRTGAAGNPDLQPMTADQFDTALEWYFGKGSMLYGTLFYKKVKGFIASAVFDEVYDGQVWQITRPVNGDEGTVKGVEVGYTQFFDFLPGWLSGFGIQTNYTYVNSEAPSPNAVDTNGNQLIVPLEGLSKNSYNAVLMYEKARFSARVAYNWRSNWLVTTAGNGTGKLPVYNKDYGQLDASIRYNISDVWSVSLDGSNLLDSKIETYTGFESRQQDWQLNDRRYGITLRANY